MAEDINPHDQKQDESQSTLPQNKPDQPAGQSTQGPTDTAYGQYIDPDYHKKQKRKKLFLIIGLVSGALILMGAVAIGLSLSSGKNTSQNPNAQTGNVAEITKDCQDEQCFKDQFALCQPATYRETEGSNVIDYKITGVHEIGCLVSFKYANTDIKEVVGKDMTCDLDNELDFQAATKLTFEYPADYECEGSLADYLLSTDNS